MQESETKKKALAPAHVVGGDSPARAPMPVAVFANRPGPTADQGLWPIIRNRSQAISFRRYQAFMDAVMCGQDAPRTKQHGVSEDCKKRSGADDPVILRSRDLTYRGVDAYHLVRAATEAFLMHECGLAIGEHTFFSAADEAKRLDRESLTAEQLIGMRDSYLVALENSDARVLPFFSLIRSRLADLPLKGPDEVLPNCYGILRTELTCPCLMELIWSYWHEEGMLVQSINAVSMRFQNRRIPGKSDALSRLEIAYLRPLTNILWGYVQDERQRLSVVRRVYEYDHHYGLTLVGKAVPTIESADSRSKFIGAFHQLLNACAKYFKQADNAMVVADGFPVLNALKDVHFLLSQGMHNQFGDLPWTARVEMLVEQWMLARPEMKSFLGGREIAVYPEPWMDRVDTMKSMMGWEDASVSLFHDLATFGEQLLLSIRYGSWSEVHDRDQAANWANYWRAEIQAYVHAYRSVTGVDLSNDPVDTTPPSVLLARRRGR